jgi:6-pyruvoyltetrahydropterin/6-carboxytetrahydropterin synthase
MYTLCLKRSFTARHFLTPADSGAEGLPHPHDYTAELRIRGTELNADEYLIDLRRVEEILDRSIGAFRDTLLNDLPVFAGRNPSLELFCRILAEKMGDDGGLDVMGRIEVRLWESEHAWASWSRGN